MSEIDPDLPEEPEPEPELDPLDEPLVTVEELEKIFEDEFDDKLREVAYEALLDATELVRDEGHARWTRQNCPRIAKTVVRAAALRYLNNPTGLTVTRAGDETQGWDGIGDKAGSVYLTDRERRLISRAARGSGITSVPVVNYAPMREASTGYVPAGEGSKPFPYFAGAGPW